MAWPWASSKLDPRTKDRSSTPVVAFTLIELLVVMAIIALMAALLVPVLAAAQERSRRSACAHNLHQIGLAVSLYAADYDGQMTPAYIFLDRPGASRGFPDLLVPYAPDPNIWICPNGYWTYYLERSALLQGRGPLHRCLPLSYSG